MRFFMMRAANTEASGADDAMVEKQLNAHGAQRYEHYSQSAAIGFLRETVYVWEYRVVTVYGNSKQMTDVLNDLAKDNWYHYLTVGSRGFFKRAISQVVDLALQDAKHVKAKKHISDDSKDRTGVPQMERGAERQKRR